MAGRLIAVARRDGLQRGRSLSGACEATDGGAGPDLACALCPVAEQKEPQEAQPLLLGGDGDVEGGSVTNGRQTTVSSSGAQPACASRRQQRVCNVAARML